MSAFATYLADSSTMLRRNARHMRRYPTIFFMVGIPIVFMLLFVYAFGGTLGAGLGRASGSRADYVAYLTPGILMLTVAGTATSTAMAIAMDMTEGIVARFRTMAVSRASFLTGHVAGNVVQTLVAVVVVAAVAVLIGFRPTTAPVDWLAAAGLLVLATLALTWLGVALGLVSGSVGTASNLPMPLMLLPFLGSGFVPAGSMPEPLRWFAENQPFTPLIETVRGLLLGTAIGDSGAIALAWCVAIAVLSYAWSLALYGRERSPR